MSTDQPLFTIATITYNSSKWVRQTIESILASSFTGFELLISDDCSADDTWNIIQEYTDPRIRAWRNEQNIGEYPNRDKVLREAKGRFILYIDGDDILYKHALSEYAEYIKAFPAAKAVWGVYPVYFDFVAFPYLFTPEQLTGLNFLSTYPVTVVGFTDSVFEVDALLSVGGFDQPFAIGDTYIKRKFSCLFNVLLVPAGRAFWRQYPQQASNRVRQQYRQLKETYLIDKEILAADYFPLKGKEKETAYFNLRNRTIKLVVQNTLRKGKLVDFFGLVTTLRIPLTDLFCIFRKGDYSYRAGASSSEPLINNYHFTK